MEFLFGLDMLRKHQVLFSLLEPITSLEYLEFEKYACVLTFPAVLN